jgi:hypothetical protein
MSDFIEPYILSVTAINGDVECSDFRYRDDARNYGRFLVNGRGYSEYSIEANQTNALSMPVILEVYP